MNGVGAFAQTICLGSSVTVTQGGAALDGIVLGLTYPLRLAPRATVLTSLGEINKPHRSSPFSLAVERFHSFEVLTRTDG